MLDSTNNAIASITHGPGIDHPLSYKNIATGQTFYYNQDYLGSITSITDSAQNMVETYRYDSYGNLLTTNDYSLTTVTYAFTGHEYDPESGLYFYRARYYDSKVGRFLEPDPIGFLGGVNFYAYVGNNPIYFVDAFGLCKKIPWWDLYAAYNRAQEISNEEYEKFAGHHNDYGDAMRHAEWSKRTAEETNPFFAWGAGWGHEIDNWINDSQPWREGLMDLHNNSEGRNAASENRQINPSNLRSNPILTKGRY